MSTDPPSEADGVLPLRLPGGPRVLAEILGGGQSFLWGPLAPHHWRGTIGKHSFDVWVAGEDRVAWKGDGSTPVDEQRGRIESYFSVPTDFCRIVDDMPWRSDPVLEEAVKAFPGLRILRQQPETALLSFLLSPLKRIDQIRAGLLEIARRWGPSPDGECPVPPPWDRLAEITEDDLRSCGIGYRARSIHQTARFLQDRPDYLQNLENAPTETARQALILLPGVGRKIADCVLLFGYGRYEAFPVDTWISRFMKSSYGLDGFTDDQVQRFARAHYGSCAGVAQQFLFAHARSLSSGK